MNPEPSHPCTESLSDLRVLDLSGNLAGPYCGQILADLGADVIKVERPGAGDPARAWAPPAWGGDGTLFLAANRGKRSLALELGSPEGAEVLRRLVARSDVVIQAFRPDVAQRFGLTEEALRPAHPRLILCTITAFGHEGPGRDRPGYDPLIQAHTGLMSVTGTARGPGEEAGGGEGGERGDAGPGAGERADAEAAARASRDLAERAVRVGTSLVDLGAGMWAALGVISALRVRDFTGEGAHVRVSLEDTGLAWSAYHLMGVEATGRVPEPMGTGLGMIAPYGAFPASDGSLMIAAGNDALFRRLCEALELAELGEEARFATNRDRVAHRDEIEREIATATRRHSRIELEARLRQAGVPCAAIRDMAEVARDPAVRGGAFRPEPHPRIPGYRAVALPPTWDGERAPVRPPPPSVGQHSAEVLEELGYAPGEPAGRAPAR